MPRSFLFIVYVLMILIGVVAMYSLLNTGNPQSLLRLIFPDPGADFYVAIISSVVVFILGFIVFYSRDRQGFQHLVKMNVDQVRSDRQKGKSDEEIADSILAAMGSSSGYRHNMARKKLMIALSEFE